MLLVYLNLVLIASMIYMILMMYACRICHIFNLYQ